MKLLTKLNGLQVTWVEHAEYNESAVHQLYRSLLRSGMGLGAQRWITTLQRQCECLAILMSSAVVTRDHTGTEQASIFHIFTLIPLVDILWCVKLA